MEDEVDARSVSSRASSRASARSNVSDERLKDAQKRAELVARSEMLKKRRALLLKKLNIELDQEQLELDTEIAVNEARSKVVDEFEADLADDDRQSEISINIPTLKAAEPAGSSTLKPNATEYVPRELPQGLEPTAADNIENEEILSVSASDGGKNIPNTTDISLVQQLRKPRQEIKKFSGDPMEYKRFMRQFESCVVMNTSSDDERLAYLDQYTVGEAHNIVVSYAYLDAEQGYHAALKELEERYGNKEYIASAFIKKALDWPIIKDNPKALDEFAIFLTECQHAASSIQASSILNYSENIKRLVAKLPFYLHDRWRSTVQQAAAQKQVAQFAHLVEFVRKEARKLNDPVYGKEALGSYNPSRNSDNASQGRSRPQRSTASFATKLETVPIVDNNTASSDIRPSRTGSDVICPCCSQNHYLSSCRQFEKLPLQEKVALLKSKGLCFGCFKRNHMMKDCRSKVTCARCGHKHNTLLHREDRSTNSETELKVVNGASQLDPEDGRTGVGDGECTMAIIPVKVRRRNSWVSVQTYAFLDPGSSVTFCTEELMQQLGVQGKELKIKLHTMTQSRELHSHVSTDLVITDMNEENVIELPKVYSTDIMPVNRVHIPTQEDLQRWPHLANIPVQKIDAPIGLLIGNNVPDAYTPLEVRDGPRNTPHAVRTLLGWIAWNVVRSQKSTEFTVNRIDAVFQELDELKKLDSLVRQSINLDFPDHIDDLKEYSQEDRRFIEKMNSSMRLVEGHYQVNLPLRSDTPLSNNIEQAKQRLRGLARRMKFEKFADSYRTSMLSLIHHNYAEKVSESEIRGTTGRVWYIPHHAVWHPRKPDKLRIVFDCAASFQGKSLNDTLLQGPNLTNSLIGVLLRFRQGHIAITSDIEAMFHQVRVPVEDRDLLRFLWWTDGDTRLEPAIYRMCVHLFGATSSPSCAGSALRKTVEDNKDEFESEVCNTVLRNFYVDDCLKSVDDQNEAIKLMHQLKRLCSRGGFNLTKWMSNDQIVQDAIPVNDRCHRVTQLDLSNDKSTDRVLGVLWNVESDELGFAVTVPDRSCTRKGLLSVVSSVYDPLGIASPFILTAKLMLQDLCARQLEWNYEIVDEDLKNWTQWLNELPKLKELVIPRCYKPKDFDRIASYQLHTFADASSVGYGVVSYLRLTDSAGRIHCSLVMSRTRVAPLKKMTIPRLELQAATTAVRISNIVKNELEFPIQESEVFFWTDSMTVLRYIKNETKRFRTFVANRIAIIRESTVVCQWNFVEGKLNPADMVTRGMSINAFLNSEQWLNGPQFLNRQWQPGTNIPLIIAEDDPEVLKSHTVNTVIADVDNPVERLLRAFSKWNQLRRSVACILIVRGLLREKIASRSRLDGRDREIVTSTTGSSNFPSVSYRIAEMLEKAEMSVVQYIQQQHFGEIITLLSSHENYQKAIRIIKHTKLNRLDPVVRDGMLRVGGRLDRTIMSYDMKHPLILPRDSPVSTLIIEAIHRRIGHQGRNAVMSSLKEKYWIIGASSIIKKILFKCVLCRRYQGPPLKQKMADLPADRVIADEPPFTRVGVDYFGPFEVKHGRSVLKRYGVIFTCLASRAVHLEVAFSLDTDSCINAIRRFRSRRGPIKIMWSDNGSNFVATNKEMQLELSKLSLEVMNELNIRWEFNPPAGSHFGGVWERLIRSVRKIMFALMKEQNIKLTDESLQTLFCEVEAILNSRPITKSSTDPNDLEALTPNHVLLLQPGQNLPCGVFDVKDNYVRRRWRQIQYLADIFWKRWSREYLSTLQARQKWTDRQRNVSEGDIVLIVDDAPRSAWALGKVTEVMKDKRGFVRSARVKTQTVELRRPIDKLCLLLEADTDIDTTG